MRKKGLSVLLAVTVIFSSVPVRNILADVKNEQAVMSGADNVLPYLDTDLSFEERAADLVSRMTLSEKQAQMVDKSVAIPRLGIDYGYDYWNEALHGVARSQNTPGIPNSEGIATSFPTGYGIAATWDKELVLDVAEATSDEARGYSNGNDNGTTYHKGLTYWSPTINLSRDPRWGRAEETYGEDQYLTAKIGASFVEGMQGNDDTYLKSIPTLKHFAANNSEYNRHNGNSEMDDRDLREYYTYAFKEITEKNKVASVMTSYNRVHDIPMSANKFMVTDLLRSTWGFNGFVVSDCGAILDIYKNHQWKPEGYDRVVNATEATALSIQAGTELNCGAFGPADYNVQIANAIDQGLMTEGELDRALIRIFTTRMRTGEFDPVDKVPYRSNEYSFDNQVEAEDHKELAEQMSDEAVVLLKNEPAQGSQTPILPVDGSQLQNIVIIGALAEKNYLGDYSGRPSPGNVSAPVEGITEAARRKNPGVNVDYIANDTRETIVSRLLNVRDFEFGYSAADVTRTMAEADEHFACSSTVSSNKKDRVNPGSYIRYDDVNLDNLNEVSVHTAGAPTAAFNSLIEVRVDSPEGAVIATLEPDYTANWNTYAKTTASVSNSPGGTHDLYITFNYRDDDIELTADEEKKIKDADLVIAYVGTRATESAMGAVNDSAEEEDRESLDLPRNQQAIVKKCLALNPSKTIMYVQSVAQMNIEPFKDAVPGIFWCTYNGQAQGNAAGRLIFGEANPSAKLPFTWYSKLYQLDHVGDYNLRGAGNSNGRTYQYFTGDITYPFGHGLSYAEFDYSNLKIDNTSVTPNDKIEVSVDVKNTGSVTGKEVVQMYVVSPEAERNDRPMKRLKGFEKVEIKPGETRTVTMTLDAFDLYFWDDKNDCTTYDIGQYEIEIGSSSSDDSALKKTFNLSGELNKELKTVTLSSEKPILYAGDSTTETILTAVLNDDSFYDTAMADVKYSSSRPEVADVNENGIVTAVGNGTATITAAVTIDGVTKTGSFSVAVLMNNAYEEIEGGRTIYKSCTFSYTLPKSVVVQAGSAGGGTIKFYVDSVSEENLLTTVNIPAGSGLDSVQEYRADISMLPDIMKNKVLGVHDIYLVFSGTGASTFDLVSFKFEKGYAVMKYVTGTGGTINGAKEQIVEYGKDADTVSAVPDAGYEFAGWSDGILTAERTDRNLVNGSVKEAFFQGQPSQETISVEYTAGAGGRINGKTRQDVVYGKDAEAVVAVADAGYEFTGWSDGIKTAGRTDKNITKAVKVSAAFKKKTTPPPPPDSSLKVGQKVTLGNNIYKITSLGKTKTVDYAGMKKARKKLTIKKSVEIQGISFKITGISSKAFHKNKKLTTVTIGSEIKTIAAKAFMGCSKLKTIKIKSTKLSKVGTKAFKGVDKKAKVKVPKKKLKNYRRRLSKKGFAKTVRITS